MTDDKVVPKFEVSVIKDQEMSATDGEVAANEQQMSPFIVSLPSEEGLRRSRGRHSLSALSSRRRHLFGRQ
jgi:hypothetical protein